MQALDPAFEFRRDVVQTALVDLDAAGGPHLARQFAQGRRFGLDAELLHLLGTDLHLASGGADRIVPAFIDRDVIHAHRILLWHR